jgi:hypothetical protein
MSGIFGIWFNFESKSEKNIKFILLFIFFGRLWSK